MGQQATPEMLSFFEDGLHAFSYDHEATSFEIAGKTVGLTDPDLMREFIFPTGERVPFEEIPDHPLYIADSRLITTELFSTWLKEHCGGEEFSSTKQVIHEVAEALTGETLDDVLEATNIVTLWGPSAGLLRPGHVVLHTEGNCACLGVFPDGDFIREEDFDSGYAEYGFHNVYNSNQRISLLAGIGHMATLSVQ